MTSQNPSPYIYCRCPLLQPARFSHARPVALCRWDALTTSLTVCLSLSQWKNPACRGTQCSASWGYQGTSGRQPSRTPSRGCARIHLSRTRWWVLIYIAPTKWTFVRKVLKKTQTKLYDDDDDDDGALSPPPRGGWLYLSYTVCIVVYTIRPQPLHFFFHELVYIACWQDLAIYCTRRWISKLGSRKVINFFIWLPSSFSLCKVY